MRSELPAEAEPPVVEIQRADRPYATFYLGFTSSERTVPQVTDWLSRTLQPQLSTLAGVQRISFEGSQSLAMRIWIDPVRLAERNLSPGDVQAALQRNNYLAAVGQTKGNLVQINLLANTDLRAAEEFQNLIVSERDGAIVRLSDVARVELGAEEAAMIAKYNDQQAVYLGVWPLPGSNEIEVASALREEMERIRPTLPADIEMRLVWDGTMFMRSALKEISKTLVETVLIVAVVVFLFLGSVRTAIVPLVAMPVSLVGAAIVMMALRLQPEPADDPRHRVVRRTRGRRRHRGGGKHRKARARGQEPHRGRVVRRARTARPHHRHDHHAGDGVHAHRLPGRAHRLIVPGVRDHAGGRGGGVRSRRAHALAGHELALRARGGSRGQADEDREPRLRNGAPLLRARAGWRAWACAAPSSAWPCSSRWRWCRCTCSRARNWRRWRTRATSACSSRRRRIPRWRRAIATTARWWSLRAFPETEFTWSLTANNFGFGGIVAKDWDQRQRSTEQMFGEVYGAVSQMPGLRVFPRLDPPLPTPGQYDVELVMLSDAPLDQMLATAGQVVGAGWQSGKFLYVDSDLKIDLPEARVVLDRERIADLGLDLASVGRELGTLLGGAYVNRFNYFERSYKVIPQIGDADRATLEPLLDLKIKTPSGEMVPVSTFTRIETSVAPRTLNRFQQANAVRVIRRRATWRDQGRRPATCSRMRPRPRAAVTSPWTTPASRARSARKARRSRPRWASR